MVNEENMGFLAHHKYLEEDSERKKKSAALEIEEMGESFINEIERKKKIKNQKSQKLIPYIIKNCGGNYDEDELNSYSYEDVLEIYNLIKSQNQSIIVKFFKFIFNIG